MTTERRTSHSRWLSWLVGCVAIAWLVVYNAMRIAGSTPADAAWISLGIGVVAGLVVFGCGLLVVRRLAASGHAVHRGPLEIPSPSQLEPAQRSAMTAAWPALALLAAVALVMGIVLAADWLGTESSDRATTTIILAAWNVLAGIWLGDEALRLRRGEADGLESAVLGCALTAVLAGVGLSRDLVEIGQVALIVLGGVAGVLAAVAAWRLQGSRGAPVGAVVIALVAALSLLLPLTV